MSAEGRRKGVRRARPPVGLNELPAGIPVEIEAIVEIIPTRARKAAVLTRAKTAGRRGRALNSERR